MAEGPSGIELMRRRMERASRQPPPPRRPRPEDEAIGAARGEEAPTAPAEEAAPPPAAPGRRAPRSPRPGPTGQPPARLAPDLPPANLAIRVRKPLDDRLADLIHALRREGLRTSKVEIIEMLLWELPDQPGEARERLRRFRRWAPRGAGAPIDDEAGD